MKNISGVMVYYYFVCKRKLWLFINDINMEHNSDLVSMGKIIDETSYNREKKNILIDESLNIDFLKEWKVIHEVKKSRKIEDASKWQIRYYMWELKRRGIHIEKGILDYPLLRKREDVILNEEDENEMVFILEEIEEIGKRKLPPEIINKPVCKKCAYYELCYI